MLTVTDFLAQLDERERLESANAIGAGLLAARNAAGCFTIPDLEHENVTHFRIYLAAALHKFDVGHAIIRRHPS